MNIYLNVLNNPRPQSGQMFIEVAKRRHTHSTLSGSNNFTTILFYKHVIPSGFQQMANIILKFNN